MGLHIKATNVIPHLTPEALEEVLSAAARAGFERLSDLEIAALTRDASRHNPSTGYSVDAVLALAGGLELKGRALARIIATPAAEPAPNDMAARQVAFMLRHYLPRVGGAELVKGLRIEADSDVEHTVWVGDSGLGISTGWDVKVMTAAGVKVRSGYRVFEMKATAATRMHPSEDFDVTLLETESSGDAVAAVGAALAREALEYIPELPPELREERVEETCW